MDASAPSLLVIPVAKDSLSQALSGLPPELAANLQTAAAQVEFKGETGTSLSSPSFGKVPQDRVVLVGSGSGDIDGLRRAMGRAGNIARTLGSTVLHAQLSGDEATLSAAWEGLQAGNYRFDRYKAEDVRKAPLAQASLAGGEAPTLAKAVVAGQSLARDLVNEPAAAIYPESLAEAARSVAATTLASGTLTVEVWDEVRIKAEGMGGITAVGQGSSRPPRFIHMKYSPAGTPRKRIALVGKGVTFDAGGLSLKPSAGMQTMRCDMAGSAAVIGTMKAIAALGPDVEVHGIVGAAENMLGAGAYKLGDILTMYSGKTVEIHNTDAEGRLVLADCLHYACQLGVDTVVDLATLTGAIIVALGDDYTGLFTRDPALASELQAHAADAGEDIWPMPMPDVYKDMLKGEWGTIKNVGGRAGGAITAALFLSEFVDGPRWAHLDIAGPAFRDKAWRHYAAGGTGAMVPTLTRWILA